MGESNGAAGVQRERRNASIFFVWAMALPIVVMLAGVALAHFEIVAPFKGFLLYVVAGLVSLIHAALLLLMRAVLKKPQWSVVAAAALPFVLVLVSAFPGIGVPRINDISTDLDDPPPFSAVAKLPENDGRDMSFPPRFADEIRKGYASLKAFTPSGPELSRAALFDAALAAAQSHADWTIVNVNADGGVIEGTAESLLFRFRDDFVIRVSEKDGKTVLDMRSKSRDGKGDLGANAKRITAFFDLVRSNLASAS